MIYIANIGRFFKYSFGNSRSNEIYGSDQHADRMYGRGGDDVFHSSLGADYYNGGSGFDTVDYTDSKEGINIDLGNGIGYGYGDSIGDTFYSIESVIGSNFRDLFTGGDNVDNVFYGRGGNDTFFSSTGSNHYDGGANRDYVSYFNSRAAVRVDLLNGDVSGGDAAGDSFTSIEVIAGSQFDDELKGDYAANTLAGDKGDDVIVGRGGNDILYGNLGSDTFIFAIGDGDDIINDFSGRKFNGRRINGEEDQIDLSDFGINGWSDLENGDNRGMREINGNTEI